MSGAFRSCPEGFEQFNTKSQKRPPDVKAEGDDAPAETDILALSARIFVDCAGKLGHDHVQ
jgi:hypothetical protein